MTIKHTASCAAAQANLTRHAQEWKAKWPNHCPSCKGLGGVWEWEVHRTGLGQPVMFECSTCNDRGACPRCGHAFADPDHFEEVVIGAKVCPACGWDANHPDVCIDDTDYCQGECYEEP